MTEPLPTSFFARLASFPRSSFVRTKAFIGAHKILSTIILLAVAGGGYYAYTTFAANKAGTQYGLTPVVQGPLQVTVKGSGQILSQNTVNLTPQASGQILYLGVTPGQNVTAGTVIARLDATTAVQAVTTARENLKAAQIAYAQTQTSSQSSVANDQTAVSTAQTNANTAVVTAFTGLPSIVNGLDTALHSLSTITGYTAETNIEAYANYINSTASRTYHDQTAAAYIAATASYQQAQSQYAANSGASGTVNSALIQTTIQSLNDVSASVRATLTYYNYINDQIVASKFAVPAGLTSQISSLTTYQTTLNTNINSLVSAQTALTNAQQTLAKDAQTLGGSSTTLDVQTAQLNVQKAQDTLDQALVTQSQYTLRAPFDGTIAAVPAHKFDQASNSTTIAALITTQEYADLSLNETDAAKVQLGRPVTMTFNALPGVTMTGTVAILNPAGTVTQGVVTYDVKINFGAVNSAVKPGMTVNAVITTASKDNALQVPSSAVKTVNGQPTVQVATVLGNATSSADRAARFAAGGGRNRAASSTSATSTTPRMRTSFTVPANRVTITSVPVTIGLTTDTVSEITSGLSPGQLVVTSTLSGNAAKTANTPPTATSLFGGGNNTVRRATGGAVRGGGG
jgi:HlyD family secretion protein